MANPSTGTGPITIKFSASKPKLKAPTSSRPRPTKSRLFGSGGGGGDSDDDDNNNNNEGGKHQAITGFGIDGAETASHAKKTYVIPARPNRDWRKHARERQKQPHEDKEKVETGRRADADTAPMKWGLTVKEKPEPEPVENSNSSSNSHHDGGGAAAGDQQQQQQQQQQQPNSHKSSSSPHHIADNAINAVLRPRSPAAPKIITREDAAFARDMVSAGEISTLADYEAMPVDEFGAALLRGMGWDGSLSKPSNSNSNSNKPSSLPPHRSSRPQQGRQVRLGGLSAEYSPKVDFGGDFGGGGGAGRKRKAPRLVDYRREEERRKEEKKRRRERERR